jgi:hypothetical protein
VTPNELIIALSEGMTPEEMNMPFSITCGAKADNISIKMPHKDSVEKQNHVTGWIGHKRKAPCGVKTWRGTPKEVREDDS